MLSFPDTITDDSFEQAWDYTARGLCKAKLRFVVEFPVSWVTDALFFCCVVLVSLGVLLEDVPVAAAYVRSLPMVAGWWETYRMWLSGLELEQGQMQILTAALVFLVPLAAGALIALVVRLVYHPKKPTLPEGNLSEKAGVLVDTAKKAHAYTRRATHNGTLLFAAFYGIAVFSFLVYVLFGTEFHGIALAPMDMSASTTIGLRILGIAVVYALLAMVLRMLTVPLYYFRFPKKVLAEAERYYRMVSEKAMV